RAPPGRRRAGGSRCSCARTRSIPRPAGPRASSRRSRLPAPRGAPTCSTRGLVLEAADQLVESQLLERSSDRAELAGAQLDQRLALAYELERLVQARLAR